MELNKIFAAILVAGIVAMLAGFVAELATETHELETDAVAIEGMAEAGGGSAAVAMPEPILGLIAAADVAQGEKLSKACAACHSFDQGGPAKVGPNLYGIVGAKKGHMAGFAYSDALIARGGNWNYSELNHFLWSPKKTIPGTKMGFIGLKKPEDRAAMIAWLKTLGGSLGNPSQAEIAAEAAELGPKEAPAETKPGDVAKDAKPAEMPAAH
jgi:cytochrome c